MHCSVGNRKDNVRCGWLSTRTFLSFVDVSSQFAWKTLHGSLYQAKLVGIQGQPYNRSRHNPHNHMVKLVPLLIPIYILEVTGNSNFRFLHSFQMSCGFKVPGESDSEHLIRNI